MIMLDTLIKWWDFYRAKNLLIAKQETIRADYRTRCKKAKTQGEYSAIQSEASCENGIIDAELSQLVTDYYSMRCRRLLVAMPDREDITMWEECEFSGHRVLTEKGVMAVKAVVRGELRETIFLFTTAFTTLTGLIGAVIGLVSVLSRK